MKVVGFDPFLTAAKAAELGIEVAASLDELLPKVDFLTVHVPLSAETKNLIGARELGLMKKSARVLNVARGGIIDEQALADALAAGTSPGPASTCSRAEPTAADNPLLKAPNVVLTPHLGATTVEAQENVAVEAAQLIADFLLKGQVAIAVNMAAVDRAELDELRLYVDLARRLGLLHAQMAHGAIRKATLSYRGELAGEEHEAAHGRVHRRAARVPAEPGREHRQRRGAGPRARHRDRRVVQPEEGRLRHAAAGRGRDRAEDDIAAGTLFGNQYLRLVQLGPYRLDAYLDGILLVFTHRDVPGPDRLHRHDLRQAQGQHRPDDRRPADAGRRGDRRAEPRQPAAGGGRERSEGPPADQQRDGGQAAARGRVAGVAGVMA